MSEMVASLYDLLWDIRAGWEWECDVHNYLPCLRCWSGRSRTELCSALANEIPDHPPPPPLPRRIGWDGWSDTSGGMGKRTHWIGVLKGDVRKTEVPAHVNFDSCNLISHISVLAKGRSRRMSPLGSRARCERALPLTFTLRSLLPLAPCVDLHLWSHT